MADRELATIQVHPQAKKRFDRLIVRVQKKTGPLERITQQKLLIRLMDAYEQKDNNYEH